MVDVKWCRTHDDVALVYGDGSVSCRWELVVEAHTDDHVLVDLPEVERLRAEVNARDTAWVERLKRAYDDGDLNCDPWDIWPEEVS